MLPTLLGWDTMAHADRPLQAPSCTAAPGSVVRWALFPLALGSKAADRAVAQCTPWSVVSNTVKRAPRLAAAQPSSLPVKQNELSIPLPLRPATCQPSGRANGCHECPASRVTYRSVPTSASPACADQK